MLRKLVTAGGILLCLGGVVTVLYLTQDANFGFIVPILHLMNIGIVIALMGLVALSKPRYAPIAGVVAIGAALEAFTMQWHDPLWATPAVLGGLLCIVGSVSDWVVKRRPVGGKSAD